MPLLCLGCRMHPLGVAVAVGSLLRHPPQGQLLRRNHHEARDGAAPADELPRSSAALPVITAALPGPGTAEIGVTGSCPGEPQSGRADGLSGGILGQGNPPARHRPPCQDLCRDTPCPIAPRSPGARGLVAMRPAGKRYGPRPPPANKSTPGETSPAPRSERKPAAGRYTSAWRLSRSRTPRAGPRAGPHAQRSEST